jgi:hypothetical protein
MRTTKLMLLTLTIALLPRSGMSQCDPATTVTRKIYVQFPGCTEKVPADVDLAIDDDVIPLHHDGNYWQGEASSPFRVADARIGLPDIANVRMYCASSGTLSDGNSGCIAIYRISCDKELWSLSVESDPKKAFVEVERKPQRQLPAAKGCRSDLTLVAPQILPAIGKGELLTMKVKDPGGVFLGTLSLTYGQLASAGSMSLPTIANQPDSVIDANANLRALMEARPAAKTAIVTFRAY